MPSVSVTVSFAGTVEPKTINSDEAGEVDPDTASLYVWALDVWLHITIVETIQDLPVATGPATVLYVPIAPATFACPKIL
jgi:hypothetical protein